MSTRALVLYALFVLACIAGSAFVGCHNWRECRAFGHSKLYCLRMILN